MEFLQLFSRQDWQIIAFFFVILFVGLFIRRFLKAKRLQDRIDQLESPPPKIETRESVSVETKKSQPEPVAVDEPSPQIQVATEKPRAKSFGKAISSWIPLLKEKTKDRDRWEEVLITSDMGPQLVDSLLDELEVSEKEPEEFFKFKLKSLLKPAKAEDQPWKQKKPWVLYVVGVNGVGKTTTLVKLGRFLAQQKMDVGVVGADTFRKAAIEQLERQCQTHDLDFFTRRLNDEQAEGVDPSSVIFDGLKQFSSKDAVLVDTSGRLHNKKNLMEELRKMKRVGSKAMGEAPHDVWLVLDATLGQNALSQAQMFHEAVELTGLILTKMDGLSRGGIIFQIFQKIRCPIWFLGLGESADDLAEFDPDEFVDSLFDQQAG